MTAVIAGVAPAARMARSMARAADSFAGIGNPWASTELSRATMGDPDESASRTSAENWSMAILMAWLRQAIPDSRCPFPVSRFPFPVSPFPIPDSRLRTARSLRLGVL
jgi:hypothetical protein